MARIYEHADGQVEMTFPYDAALIAALKRALGPRNLRWSRRRRCWVAKAAVAGEATQLLRERYPDAELTGWNEAA